MAAIHTKGTASTSYSLLVVASKMSDKECSSGFLWPKTLEEIDVRLAPLASNRTSVPY